MLKAKRLYDKDGNWVGIEHVITEYWAVGSEEWVVTPFEFDPTKSERLAVLPQGIEHLPRKKVRKRT